MKNWLVFSVFLTIFVSFLSPQIEAKKPKPKRCRGPSGKIFKKKDVINVDDCYEKICTWKGKWNTKLKREQCCKYKKTIMPMLSRKEIEGVTFICFKGNLKEVPSNQIQSNMTESDKSGSNMVGTERSVPKDLQHFEMFDNNTAVFQFDNNEKAIVKLKQDGDKCIYRATFTEEIDSRVLVTGCQGEDKSIQIQSLLFGDFSATIAVNGSVVLPEDTDQFSGRIGPDYFRDTNVFKKFVNISYVRLTSNIQPPATLTLPIRVYMSPLWRTKFGKSWEANQYKGRSKAEEILSHVKYWFMHRSLKTKIHILTVDEEFFSTEVEYFPTNDNLLALKSAVRRPGDGHAAIVYLTGSGKAQLVPGQSVSQQGILKGFAILARVCEGIESRSMTMWDHNVLLTAQTLAHEIGHNLGYYHDFMRPKTDPTITTSNRDRTCGPGADNGGPDNDLMNHNTPMQNKWSDCTNEDFRYFYSSPNSTCFRDVRHQGITNTWGTHCVRSPGYPHNYPDYYRGENSSMIPISVPEGYGIEITFHVFDVEYEKNCAFDYVQIYNGHGHPIRSGKMCGNFFPANILIKETSAAAIYFHSDHSVRRQGFEICYKPAYIWCATVYEHTYMNGEELELRDEEFHPQLEYAGLGNWNDKISSLRVRSGCKLYYGRDWFNTWFIGTGDHSFMMFNFNDAITSLYCTCS